MISLALQLEKEKRPNAKELLAILNDELVFTEIITQAMLDGLYIDNASEIADFVDSNASDRQMEASIWL